jgi:hypothetical protein
MSTEFSKLIFNIEKNGIKSDYENDNYWDENMEDGIKLEGKMLKSIIVMKRDNYHILSLTLDKFIYICTK